MKLRVIAGWLKGRQFSGPPGNRTHPMSEKLRGAIFNMLGDINGLRVLDAYAGSGALAFEALSRGAAQAVAIDKDRAAYRQIVMNARSLEQGKGKLELVHENASAWASNHKDQKFDVVLLDPPYDEVRIEALQTLSDRTKSGGIVIISLPSTMEPPALIHAELLTQKTYGDAQLVCYRRI